ARDRDDMFVNEEHVSLQLIDEKNEELNDEEVNNIINTTVNQINSSPPSFSLGMTQIVIEPENSIDEEVVEPANNIETVSQIVADLNKHGLGSSSTDKTPIKVVEQHRMITRRKKPAILLGK
ncbi:hypothetical protein MKX03_033791, partial [Papaver bracteatum]